METPFVFGKLATGDDFTNRSEEIDQLMQNFLSGINTILISPRRWGKSSLVEKTVGAINSKGNNIRIINIDLFNIRTEEDFYRNLAEQTLRRTSSKIEELMSFAKKFFRQWIPKISFSPDHFQEFSLGLDWHEVKKNPEEILNLPEEIAVSKKWKIIICIDEFQNIGFFSESLAFQKQLRAHWQRHQEVSYCLYGSKRHMMMEVFSSPAMPFYKFGDLMFLKKISLDNWQKFLISRFHSTRKEITSDQALKIASLVDCHPYYVQQLGQLCWLRCSGKMTNKIIDLSLESLVLQLSMLFQNLTESLSTTQVNFLQALINEESMLSSKDIINKYYLGTSANVSRIRQALVEKEIIDTLSGKTEILDPLYRIWLKGWYFR